MSNGKGDADSRVGDRESYRRNYDDIFRGGGKRVVGQCFEGDKIRGIIKRIKGVKKG